MLKKLITFFAICLGALCFDLFFIIIFVNSTVVVCTLQGNEAYTCHIQTLLLGKVPTFNRDVANVVDITLARDSCDDGCSYRAEFVTTDGNQIPLSDVYTDLGPVREQVETLHPQLAQRAETINYTTNPPWWLLFLFGGLTMMTILLAPLVFLRRR